MPHPEQEHSLRIQLATALRERDTEREFRGAAEAAFAEQLARTEAAESALAAANARAAKMRKERDSLRATFAKLIAVLDSPFVNVEATKATAMELTDAMVHARTALSSGVEDG